MPSPTLGADSADATANSRDHDDPARRLARQPGVSQHAARRARSFARRRKEHVAVVRPLEKAEVRAAQHRQWRKRQRAASQWPERCGGKPDRKTAAPRSAKPCSRYAVGGLGILRLWLPMGMHFAWNCLFSAVFSVPVSGHEAQSWVQGSMSGTAWLSGGVYGVGASASALLVWAVASALLLQRAHSRGRFMPRSNLSR